jgi:hypothetical protein
MSRCERWVWTLLAVSYAFALGMLIGTQHPQAELVQFPGGISAWVVEGPGTENEGG